MCEAVDTTEDSQSSTFITGLMVDNYVHSLDNCVDLMPSLRAFRLLAVEHYSVLHLVEQTTTLRVGEGDDYIFFFVLQVLSCPGDGATRSCPRNESVDETTGLSPDLRTGPIEVSIVVASVLPHP